MKLPTLKKFLDNPSYLDGKKYGKFWKEKQDYETRWKYYKDIFKNLELTYFLESNESYYVMVEVPSERMGNTYDVIIHFYTDSDVVAHEGSLNNYYISFFCNNPAFAFRFAYANYHAGIMIPFLVDKLPRAMIELPAKTNNPNSAVGYDHTFHHTANYLLSQLRFLNKAYINSHSLQYHEKVVYELTRPFEKIMEQYKDKGDRSELKSRFNKDKSVKDEISDVISDARAKLGQGAEKVAKTFDAIKKKVKDSTNSNHSAIHRVNKTTAKKSNLSRRGTSGVHIIKAKKSNTK